MKPRHAAALALVDWYLMIPPLNEHSYRPQPDLPLSEWWQHQSFDSAQECESACNSDSLPDRMRANNAKCIATDDPRLKEK